MSSRPKVFGIGFHKTATKSLATALQLLGYRVHGPDWTRDAQACASLDALWAIAEPVISDYDAFQDNPWPLLWSQLRNSQPDALFVLTLRDERQWLDSALRYFGSETTPMRQLIYGEDAGSPQGNQQRYLQRYRAHNAEVREAFDGSDRLLELDITAGDGWLPLCEFLQLPTPQVPFPHANRGGHG